MRGSDMGGWVILAAFAAVPLVLVILGIRGAIRNRKRLPGWLEERGYRPQAIEARYFTKGPFEDISLPGTKHGDQLYRALATDRAGVQHVLWVRMPTSWPGHARPWELRRDEAPARTWRGLGTAGFYALAVVLMALVMSGIVLFSRALRG